MINPQVVKDFLETSTLDMNKVKEMSGEDAIARIVSELSLPDGFFATPLFDHQKKTLLLCCKYGRMNLWLDLGTGKSRVMIEFLRCRKHSTKSCNALVLVPNNVNIGAWTDELGKFGSGLDYAGFSGDSAGLTRALLKPSGIIVTTYAAFVYVMTRVISKVGNLDVVIMDESTSVKNHQTKTFKFLSKVCMTTPNVFALTGTPFGRDVQDLWSQYFLIDRGETLGKNITLFRQAFMEQHINRFRGYEYSLRKDRKEILQSRLYNRAIRYTTDECIDLPESTYIPVHFRVQPDVEQMYALIAKSLATSKSAVELESVFVKMRYLTSGYMAMKIPDGVDKNGDQKFRDNVVFFPVNPKLDGLLEIISETSEKVVVFVEYVHTAKMILDALMKAKVSHASIFSSRQIGLEKFMSGTTRVLVATSASASMGINLQIANYMVFYESPVSPLIRQQAEKRICRSGQTKHTFYYDLIMRDTIDEKILSYVAEGRNLLTSLLKHIAR